MTDTPALLPPNPDRDGYYWFRSMIFDGELMIWRWSAKDQTWTTSDDFIMDAANVDPSCTLAIPHPIPSAAALERLYALPDEIVRSERESSKDAPNDYRIIGIGAAKTAAAMLRAALEDKG